MLGSCKGEYDTGLSLKSSLSWCKQLTAVQSRLKSVRKRGSCGGSTGEKGFNCSVVSGIGTGIFVLKLLLWKNFNSFAVVFGYVFLWLALSH